MADYKQMTWQEKLAAVWPTLPKSQPTQVRRNSGDEGSWWKPPPAPKPSGYSQHEIAFWDKVGIRYVGNQAKRR